jgi:glycosyltransferase involved in cell wall biosynthesis
VVRILFFGSYDADRHPRVRVLLQGLAARGHDVRECNVPLRAGTAQRLRALHHPVLSPLIAVRLLGCWARLVPRALAVRRPDVIVVGYLGQFDVLLARALWPRVTVVLDHLVPAAGVADDHGVSGRWRRVLLERIDGWAVSVADVVLVDTVEHLSELSPLVRGRAVVVPVGAADAFHRQVPCPDPPPLRALFVGTFAPLHGAVVIARAIALVTPRVDVRITMVGRGPELAHAQRIAGRDRRVRWVDWIEPSALPGEFARHQVCLGIFGTTGKAARVVPTKVYQGAAAGCAIVTGDGPAQRRALGASAFTVPSGDPQALANVLTFLADHPDMVSAARRRTASVAVRYTPYRAVEPLHDRLLGRVTGDRGRRSRRRGGRAAPE